MHFYGNKAIKKDEFTYKNKTLLKILQHFVLCFVFLSQDIYSFSLLEFFGFEEKKVNPEINKIPKSKQDLLMSLASLGFIPEMPLKALNKDSKVILYTSAKEDSVPAVLLSSFEKPILIHFWATWCRPCIKELPLFLNFMAKNKDKFEFIIISKELDTNLEKLKHMFELAQQNNFFFPHHGRDIYGSLGNQFRISGVPSTVVVHNKKIVGKFVGPVEWDTPELQETLTKYLGV